MSTTVTCTNCQQTWAPVPSIMKAHPGATSYKGGHWVSAGPSAVMTREDQGTAHHFAWTCLCGHPMGHSVPALERVPCQKCNGRTLDARTVGMAVLHACPCCGYSGGHWVRKDRVGQTPACLKVTA